MRALPLALDILPPESEARFQTSVIQLARLLGWRVQWWWTSKNSPSGFPDLFMIRGSRAIAAELKRQVGMYPRPSQQVWLDELARVPGIESYCWTPGDWHQIVATLQGVSSGTTRSRRRPDVVHARRIRRVSR